MSIADKLTQIAENEQKALTAFANINTALTEKGVSTADTLADVPEQIGSIKAEPMYFPYIGSCYQWFHSVTFPENTELVIELPNFAYAANDMFQATKNVISAKLICHNEHGESAVLAGVCRYNSHIRKLDLSEFDRKIQDMYMAFNGCLALEEIVGTLEVMETRTSSAFTNCFTNCTKLKEIRFANSTNRYAFTIASSPLLSDDSIQSIIDGLADLTGGTAKTLTFHADVGGKLTEAQKAVITAKNWTLVY